jgi:LEA14-like dessication related protein
MTRRSIIALALVVLAGATGCRTLARQVMANPIVSVKDVVVKGIGFDGGSLDVILDVENPNEFRMDATRITYEVWVDSSSIATGAIDRMVTLAQKGRTEVTVPVSFTYDAVRTAVVKYMQLGSLDYRITGQFTVVTPFGNITRPYAGTGTVQGMP